VLQSDTSSVTPSSSHRIAWIRFTARACVLQSEKHVNKMVLWSGLGRRQVSLHTSEEATACSSLSCAARCILFTVPRACILFVFWRAADLLIVRSARLFAGITLMVYGYRIIMLRCRWLITPVIRGKTSTLISWLCAGVTGIAEILFEQPVRLLQDYRRFHYRGSRNYFFHINRQWPSTGHYQRRAECGHNQQNHGTNNRRLQRLSRPTWRLTRRSK